MQLSNRLVDFNKQILIGEVGATVGTLLSPYIIAHFTADPDLISFSAVVGGLVAGSVFWFIVKLRDERRMGPDSARTLAWQIALFTPAALVAGLTVYQPTLFFVARHLIISGFPVVPATFVAQFAAFMLFLLVINIYRVAVQRLRNKHL